MFFASDNSSAVPPQVMEALARANTGFTGGYGNDPLTERVTAQIRDLFEAPEAAVYLVPTGSAANALALACLCPPWGTVFCTPMAHINVDEANAPEFYMGGAKLTLVGDRDRMQPDALRAAIEGEGNRFPHGPARGPVSITQVAEDGNVYTMEELRALTAVARDYGLPVHLDGARYANALVKLAVTPAEMSWKAGVDICIFGGTKNGLMGVEAVVIFDPAKAEEFQMRRKRGGHLFSKHRYLAAQMEAYLDGNLWHDLASAANASCDALREGLEGAGVEIVNDTHANMLFVRMPRGLHRAVMTRGAVYYLSAPDDGPTDEMVTGRLVTSWSTTDEDVSAFVDAVRAG